MLARIALAGAALTAIVGSHVSGAAALPGRAAPSPSLRLKVATEAALPEAAIGLRGADFDGDGRNDLAFATAAGDVYAALNPGGDLSSWPWALVGSAPLGLGNPYYSGLAVADLDGDALSDLILFGDAEAPGACSAVALLSLGDGNFAAGATLAIAPPAADDVVFGCTDAAIGDYDGDGALDVAVAFAYQPIDWFNGLLGAVNVFRGAGGGEFEAPALYTLAPDPEPYVSFAMASGDFDGDGQADFGFGSAVRYLSGPIAWRAESLRGDGGGGFVPGALRPFDCSWCELRHAAAADFDGDGRDDLVLAPTNPDDYPSDYPVLLFASGTDGNFAAPEELLIQAGAIGVEAGDVTADGAPDVLLASDVDHVTVLDGRGDGSFAAPRRFVSGRAIAGQTLVDLDGDGLRELVLLGDGPQPVFEIARGAGDGAFELPLASPVPSGYAEYLAPGDFDGDGTGDVLAIGYDGLELMLGTGDGRFVLGARTPLGVSPWPLPVADLNGDGRLDLVQAAGEGFAVALGLADGSFAPTPPAGDRSIGRAALGDLDGDGALDLVAVEWPSESIDIYLGDGALAFHHAGSLPLDVSVSELILADLNSDGRLDLLAGASGVRPGPGGEPPALLSPLWLGDGCGGFEPGDGLDVSGSAFRVADLDGDGALDVVGTNALAFGDGVGHFGPSEPLPSAGALQLELADLDGDGFSDLLFERSGLQIARGGPDGRFSPPQLVSGASRWQSFAVAQVVGSPAPDVLALHTFTIAEASQAELIVLENLTAPACGRRR